MPHSFTRAMRTVWHPRNETFDPGGLPRSRDRHRTGISVSLGARRGLGRPVPQREHHGLLGAAAVEVDADALTRLVVRDRAGHVGGLLHGLAVDAGDQVAAAHEPL